MDTEKLLKLNALKEKGVLTQDEFDREKRIILSSDTTKIASSKNKSKNKEKIWIFLGIFSIVLFVALMIIGTYYNIQDRLQNEGVTADLSVLYDLKKENEYTFDQKFKGKEFTLLAEVSGVDMNCNVGDRQIPCVDLVHPEEVYVNEENTPVVIASAQMLDTESLAYFKTGQLVKLTCIVDGDIIFDDTLLSLNNCRLYDKKGR